MREGRDFGVRQRAHEERDVAAVPGEEGSRPCQALGAWGAALPGGLSPAEREHRLAVLRDIERRIVEDGPHVARSYPGRARQFMPFAALRGYGEMTDAAEDALTRVERHEPTEEECLALSEAVASLSRGERVSLSVYDGERGRYHQVSGTVEEVALPLHAMRVGGEWVDFGDVGSLERGGGDRPTV